MLTIVQKNNKNIVITLLIHVKINGMNTVKEKTCL